MAQKRKISRGGTRGTVFEAAARSRHEDAAVLFGKGRYSGAIYLAGYSIECLLKRAVTIRHQLVWLPQKLETHNLDLLLAESGLIEAMKTNKPLFAMYTEVADSWSTELRYTTGSSQKRDTERLYRQMVQIYCWFNEQL